jgi:plasmid stabilization system protein ParE
MARQVVWTDPGWDDLEATAEYIARDSEFYAAAFVQEAREAAAILAEFADRPIHSIGFGRRKKRAAADAQAVELEECS